MDLLRTTAVPNRCKFAAHRATPMLRTSPNEFATIFSRVPTFMLMKLVLLVEELCRRCCRTWLGVLKNCGCKVIG